MGRINKAQFIDYVAFELDPQWARANAYNQLQIIKSAIEFIEDRHKDVIIGPTQPWSEVKDFGNVLIVSGPEGKEFAENGFEEIVDDISK